MRANTPKQLALGLAVTGALVGCVAEPPDSTGNRTSSSQTILPRADRTIGADPSAFEPRTLFEDEETSADAKGLTEPIVDRGSGRVLGQPSLPADVGVNLDDAGDLTLNVVDADIREVVRLILEDGLGANYVIDPAVTGTVTVRTSRPVPASDVVGMLNSILGLNGAALIQQGNLYKIVPADQAIAAGGAPATRSSIRAGRQGATIQVAPLRYADAVQLADLLQPFVGNQGAIQVDTSRNALLMVGSADQNATLMGLVDMFDVDWMAGMSFGLYPLKAAGATQLAEELDQILGDPEIGIATGALRFVPLDRLNALLAISTQPDLLDRVETWIGRLDKPGDGDGDQVYVYSVQNGRASDLAAVLGELFDIRSTAIGEESLLAPGLEPIELGASLPTFSPEESAGGLGTERRETGREPLRSTNTRSRQRQGGQGSFGQRALTEGSEDSNTRIVADEANNALLIRAPANEYRKIQTALRELDKQPLQVLLEATIAEVSLRDELRYGVQWFFGSGNSGVTFSAFEDGVIGAVFPGFSGVLSRGDVRAVINALDAVTDVKVISSPQILVLDNQTARLEVGDEVPIVTRQAEGLDGGNLEIVNEIELRQTGVILSVTPRVNANGLVVLDIEQEVSDVVTTTSSGIDSPTIAQRRIGTSVAVGSDQTIALGGLIQDDIEEVRLGIPVLHELPFIGWLFGATSTINDRTELLVLITPKVLTNQQEAIAATEELRRRLQSIEPLEAKIRNVQAAREPVLRDNQVARPSFLVQLGSLVSEEEALTAWPALEKAHQQDFEGRAFNINKVLVDNQVAYRLQVGPFEEIERANLLCMKITARGGDCLVVEES